MAEGTGETVAPVIEEPVFQERERPSRADMYRALVENRGNISKTARQFGIRRQTAYDMVTTSPELSALVDEFRESVIDQAEDNIFAGVEKGEESASRFVLGTLGKKRGWAQGVEGTGKGGSIGIEIVRFTGDPNEP